MTIITRPAAVAGMFYPDTRQQLVQDIDALMEQAEKPALLPKALIVPHAGYIYSGPVAASAYACLAALHGTISRVVMLAPAHRLAVQGLATSSAQFFRTPLGDVPIDDEGRTAALRLPQVQVNDAAHAHEHAIEVHLPFLQTLLDDFSLLPFVVGMASDDDVAEVLELLWGDSETLILISSDLSHYHPYAEARQIDRATVSSIEQLQRLEGHQQACGATPINGLIAAARRHHLSPHLLDLRNSGDTAGDKSRVVGYASFAFTEDNRAGSR
jgi:AmmeMemoRadiSam system protein B